MSAASKKADPFNFDDIYRQAGVEDLFVKKTMGELKQKSPGPAPGSAVHSSRSVAAAPTPAPGPGASTFDLDFLSSIATPSGGGTPNNLSKHGSVANLAAASPQPDLQQQRRPQTPSSALDDPFALFQEVPGAAPVQRHAPPPAPAAPPLTGTGNLLDFDDGLAFPAATPAPVAPTPPAAASLMHGAASGNVGLEQHISGQPPSAPSVRPAAYSPAAQPPPQPQVPSLAAAQPPSPAPPPPPPAYDDHEAHHTAPSGPAPRPLGSDTAAPTGFTAQHQPPPPAYRRGRSSSGGGSAGDGPPDYAHQRQPHHYSPHDAYAASSSSSASPPIWAGHSAPVPHGSSGGGAGGISGYLKAFGKKAVRVAKAGLAQLEHALEGLDAAAAQQQHQHHYATAPGRSHDDGAGVSHDEALAWAVRLGDMAPHAQQQELAQMAPPLRRKVIEVLREQVRTEHEAARAGGPGPHPGPGTGHGAAPDAYPGAPAPGYGQGHGHGGPMPPPFPGAGPSPRDGAHGREAEQQRQQPLSGAGSLGAGPAMLPSVTSPPPTLSQAGRQPQAGDHDLLGMGSGEVRPPGPGPAAPPPVPAPVPAAPVMDDLLGFGSDGPAPAPAAVPAQAAPLPQATTPARPAAPAATPAPAAAVHVDDMDDFFSGGAGGSASRAASGAMHTSASAPSLGGRAAASAAGGGGSRNPLVADFLHDDGGDLGGLGAGGGADVDVSGYEELYKGEQGDANEPEIRKRLRAQREAAKHAKMKAALAEKLAMEAEEAARREQQVTLKEAYKANIEAWKNKNKGNIRGLLGSLHTVLWPDSGWVPVSVADLLEPAQIKKVYMRANLLVHPDKVRQRNGSAEQVAIADMVFDVLKDAWNLFR